MDASAVISMVGAFISVAALAATVSQARSAKTQATLAKTQADSAQQQAQVAVEQLRLMQEDRSADLERARVGQAEAVFLTPAQRQEGGSCKGPNETSSAYPVGLTNKSTREI